MAEFVELSTDALNGMVKALQDAHGWLHEDLVNVVDSHTLPSDHGKPLDELIRSIPTDDPGYEPIRDQKALLDQIELALAKAGKAT